MAVKVRFFANVKQIMGKEEVTLNLAPSKRYRIKDILREIARSENKDLSTVLVEAQGRSRGTVRIVLNGKVVHSLDGLETTIKDGDEIAIFPLLAGGQKNYCPNRKGLD
jgi:molybdopterin synthase sulfur carrier subunit